MARWLDVGLPDFEEQFQSLLAPRGAVDSAISDTVRRIVAEVRRRGDAALRDYAAEFEGWAPEGSCELPEREWKKATSSIDPILREALELCARRIRGFHELDCPAEGRLRTWRDDDGLELGWKWTAVERVGVYAPGGRASYPSSVLMAAVPARVAGVKEIVLCTPAAGGEVDPAILAAARIAGVDRVFRAGGAQAVAAMACGTETLPAADVVVGPGNAYVAEAKRQVYGEVGIEAVAGPTEVAVLADDSADADQIAWDLLAQAEHDPLARSLLMTDSEAFGRAVEREVEKGLAALANPKVARESWRGQGVVILVESMEQAPALVDRLAPEHVQICARAASDLARQVRYAGALFVGAQAPEAVGDYIAGPSHVLPTARNARFASGLSVFSFLRRTSLVAAHGRISDSLMKAAEELASAEGLEAHARSLRVRRRAI